MNNYITGWLLLFLAGLIVGSVASVEKCLLRLPTILTKRQWTLPLKFKWEALRSGYHLTMNKFFSVRLKPAESAYLQWIFT